MAAALLNHDEDRKEVYKYTAERQAKDGMELAIEAMHLRIDESVSSLYALCVRFHWKRMSRSISL